MTKKLYQQLLNSALRRRLKEMTNWIFLNLFFSILRFCFLLHLCACALASSILLFFWLGTLRTMPLFLSSYVLFLLLTLCNDSFGCFFFLGG